MKEAGLTHIRHDTGHLFLLLVKVTMCQGREDTNGSPSAGLKTDFPNYLFSVFLCRSQAYH